VSQLFKMQFPDMAKEGMPFDTTTASLKLDNGVLSSDDLLIDSDAMKISMTGEADLVHNKIDATVGISPLGTVDKLINNIPIAGWVLGGKEQSLLLALFKVDGPVSDPNARLVPARSISSKAVGIFRRLLNLPVKIFKSPGEVLNNQGKKSP
ncbi:MAG: AsmA-like C-terminal domain-containing protein, partial [Deltaproteobacteria bacterium]|nr:AsmA-like C-terminal domain-containing protein [Deltaproteobacteria bacterium]